MFASHLAGRASLLGTMLAAGVAVASVPAAPDSIDILNTPLEQLGEIPVVSVSRREEPLRDAAAAVFVLEREDIRRSGARNIPDALRLVPGVEVSRVDGNKWAVSIRGFHSRSSNKLLVLVDGRNVYDPLFAGVFWEALDIPLLLIERIEVVRGPGGAQWGVNAVNGVINIITREAQDAPSFAAVAGAGDYERAFVALAGSGRLGETDLLGYAKHSERGPGEAPGDNGDEAVYDIAGLRGDVDLAAGRLQFKLEGFQADVGDRATPSPANRTDEHGENLMLRWQAAPGNGVERWVAAYADRFVFDTPVLFEERRTADVEFRQVHGAGGARQVSWGFGYRVTSDELDSDVLPVLVNDPERTDETLSAFIEGAFDVGERGRLTAGTKVEHNDYTGFEWQPSIRYARRHAGEATSWAALSRAVRIPSRLESDLAVPGAMGNPNMAAEVLIAAEFGQRRPIGAALWLDGTLFAHDYDRLLSSDAGTFGNGINARGMGGELALRWQPASDVRADFAYAYLDLDADLDPGSTDAARAAALEGGSARHRASVHLFWDPDPRFSVDAVLRHVSDIAATAVDAYTVADLRFAWHLTESLDLVLVGRDLFSGTHAEQRTASSTDVAASGFVLLRWRL